MRHHALRRPRLASLRGRRARLRAQGRPVQAGRAAAARRQPRCSAAASARAPCPAMRFEDGEKVAGSRAIMRARSTSCAPEPPLLPADPARRGGGRGGRALGRRGLAADGPRACCGRRFTAQPARDARLPGGRERCRSCPMPVVLASRRWSHAGRAPAERRRPTTPCARTCARCPASWTASTPGIADGDARTASRPERRRPADRADARGCCYASATSGRASTGARRAPTRSRTSRDFAGVGPARRAAASVAAARGRHAAGRLSAA